MSEEERLLKIAKMEADAKAHEEEKGKVFKLREIQDKLEKDNEERQKKQGQAQDRLGPSFIYEMGKSVISDSKTGTLEDRVKRAAHTVQRTNLDDRGLLH